MLSEFHLLYCVAVFGLTMSAAAVVVAFQEKSKVRTPTSLFQLEQACFFDDNEMLHDAKLFGWQN